MTYVLSEDAIIYYNSGTYGVPTWVELTNVRDVSLNLEMGEIDVTTRASGGWTENVPGLLTSSVDFGMLWDNDDAGFTAVREAFFAKSGLEFLVLDGAHDATDGNSQGLRATCMIGNFTRNETLGEALTVDVSIKPVKNSSSSPEWYTQ